MTVNRTEITGTAWPPQVRLTFDRLTSWAAFWAGMLALTCAGAFVLVPTAPTWRHFVVAGLFTIKGGFLLVIGLRLLGIVRGKGRRRVR